MGPWGLGSVAEMQGPSFWMKSQTRHKVQDYVCPTSTSHAR